MKNLINKICKDNLLAIKMKMRKIIVTLVRIRGIVDNKMRNKRIKIIIMKITKIKIIIKH